MLNASRGSGDSEGSEVSVDEKGLRQFVIAELKQKRNVLITHNGEDIDEFINNDKIPPYHHYSKNFLFVNFVLKNQFSGDSLRLGPMGPEDFSNLLPSISSELDAQVQKIKS